MKFFPKKNQKAFTLVEIIVVVLIIGVLGGVLYTIFFTNWFAFEDRIARANLWSEVDVIFETISSEARNQDQITVNGNPCGSVAILAGGSAQPIIYTMNNNGDLTVNRGAGDIVLTNHLDFANSSFCAEGEALRINLTLEDQLITRRVEIRTSTEVFPRN